MSEQVLGDQRRGVYDRATGGVLHAHVGAAAVDQQQADTEKAHALCHERPNSRRRATGETRAQRAVSDGEVGAAAPVRTFVSDAGGAAHRQKWSAARAALLPTRGSAAAAR